MADKEYCHICGKKIKVPGEPCKVCHADPSERFIAECRGAKYANSFIVSTYVNMVITDRRLLAFEDIKGALVAGVVAGVGGGGSAGAARVIQTALGGSATERVVSKGINGSLKMETPLSGVTGVEVEIKKHGVHYLFNITDQKKPYRVDLGTSFDGSIEAGMFRDILLAEIQK